MQQAKPFSAGGGGARAVGGSGGSSSAAPPPPPPPAVDAAGSIAVTAVLKPPFTLTAREVVDALAPLDGIKLEDRPPELRQWDALRAVVTKWPTNCDAFVAEERRKAAGARLCEATLRAAHRQRCNFLVTFGCNLLSEAVARVAALCKAGRVPQARRLDATVGEFLTQWTRRLYIGGNIECGTYAGTMLLCKVEQCAKEHTFAYSTIVRQCAAVCSPLALATLGLALEPRCVGTDPGTEAMRWLDIANNLLNALACKFAHVRDCKSAATCTVVHASQEHLGACAQKLFSALQSAASLVQHIVLAHFPFQDTAGVPGTLLAELDTASDAPRHAKRKAVEYVGAVTVLAKKAENLLQCVGPTPAHTPPVDVHFAPDTSGPPVSKKRMLEV